MPTATPAAPAIRSDRRCTDENHEQGEERGEEAVQHLAVEMDVVPDEIRVERREQRGGHREPARCDGGTDGVDEQRRAGCDPDLDQRHGGPGVTEPPVDRGEEERVERLRVGRRDTGQEAERAAVHERQREAVALLRQAAEQLAALDGDDDEPRQRRCEGDRQDGCAPAHAGDAVVPVALLPELEHHERPDPLAVVGSAVRVLAAGGARRPRAGTGRGHAPSHRGARRRRGRAAPRGTSARRARRSRPCRGRGSRAEGRPRTRAAARPCRSSRRAAGGRGGRARAPRARSRAAAPAARASSPSTRYRPCRGDRPGRYVSTSVSWSPEMPRARWRSEQLARPSRARRSGVGHRRSRGSRAAPAGTTASAGRSAPVASSPAVSRKRAARNGADRGSVRARRKTADPARREPGDAAGQPVEACGERVGPIPLVATEDLVAAVADERHGHEPTRVLADQVRRQRRRCRRTARRTHPRGAGGAPPRRARRAAPRAPCRSARRPMRA